MDPINTTASAELAMAAAGDAAARMDSIRILRPAETERGKLLAQYRQFFECRQHDHQASTWDGMPRDPGVGYMRERLRPSGFVPTNAIPYGRRKPSASVPLGRQIVSRFTEMLLGEGRAPTIDVPADDSTERYLRAVFREAMIWDVLMEASDVAGACGSAAVAAAVVEGMPTAEVIYPEDVIVLRWATAAYWQPADVIEQRLVSRLQPNPETGGMETVEVWTTRRWTEEEVIYYQDVPKAWPGEQPIPVRERVRHGLARCPVVWYQRTRNTRSPDGMADFEGCQHLMDELDRVQSAVVRATKANTDPTLVIQDEERYLRGEVLRKGTGAAIPLSPKGSVKYLEMSGVSIRVGLEVAERLYMQICETAECVIVNPSMAGAYRSGEAIQLLWRSMEAKTNRLRVPLVVTMQSLARIFADFGRVLGVSSMEDPRGGIVLPPVVTRVQPTAEEAEAALSRGEQPEPRIQVEPQEVGTGSHVTFAWPPYWEPTSAQIEQMSRALTAGKTSAIVSAESSVRTFARYLGIDAAEELTRIAAEKGQETSALDAALRTAAMQTEEDEEDEDAPEEGAEPEPPEDEDEEDAPESDEEDEDEEGEGEEDDG